MIAYEDLDLRIRADGDRFVVFAQCGSQTATESFELDLSLNWDLWNLPGGWRRDVEDRGATLFDAAIQGEVRDLYQEGLGSIGSDTSRGLRIRILIDPRDERLRPLLRLPWEILCDRFDRNHPLALDARRPVVRMIDSMKQQLDPAPLPIRRVMLALAQPSDTLRLDLKRERTSVESVLRRNGTLPRVLEAATRSTLHAAILGEQPQILHFLGHGTLDPVRGEGALLVEDEDRKKDPLSASELARFFAGRPAPRLVILTSCLTGVSGPEETFGPFSSVAAALVAAGLPAVIAMQAQVRDTNAIRFTERLYEAVLGGDPIEAAVSAARVALHLKDTQSPDWAAPVLFVRAQGGGTLEPRRAEPLQPTPQLPPQSHNPPAGDGSIQIHGNVQNVTQTWNKR